MNVLEVDPANTSFRLAEQKNVNKAYISATSIGVTTCGTRINCDYVFPQKTPCTLVRFNHADITEVHAKIDNQPVIALASSFALDQQKMFDFCAKKEELGNSVVKYSDCKHVKLLIAAKDVFLAR